MNQKQYVIFHDDCEITVLLLAGDRTHMESVREGVIKQMDTNPYVDNGIVAEMDYLARWEITGGKLGKDFDMNQIMEVTW